jgi:hypothetical protein
MASTFTFPVHSFRHIETPFLKSGRRNYYAVTEVRNLPDLSKWREVNVRDPKLIGRVPNAIKNSVNDKPDTFLFMNRGLCLTVDSISFDNKNSNLTITFDDPKIHGLLDGGHTYSVIVNELDGLNFPQYIKLEFLEGFSSDEITNIVDARNTSKQVQDESLLEKAGVFDELRAAINTQHYASQIAYKEYQLNQDGSPKPIDIRDVIAILTCFDVANFSSSNHPTIAYSSKGGCLDHFDKNQAAYKDLYPIADDLLRLHDKVYELLPDMYNQGRKDATGASGKFGALTGVSLKKRTKTNLYFTGRTSEYSIPSGFVYPILASFRAFLRKGSSGYEWIHGVDPEKLLKGDLGKELANDLGNEALKERNPSKTGKSAILWRTLYQSAENLAQRLEMEELRARIR